MERQIKKFDFITISLGFYLVSIQRTRCP